MPLAFLRDHLPSSRAPVLLPRPSRLPLLISRPGPSRPWRLVYLLFYLNLGAQRHSLNPPAHSPLTSHLPVTLTLILIFVLEVRVAAATGYPRRRFLLLLSSSRAVLLHLIFREISLLSTLNASFFFFARLPDTHHSHLPSPAYFSYITSSTSPNSRISQVPSP